ncbi:c-type cytochrome [Deinococcus cellulosilyticus]|uniref:C-type cytochrome n=1 Tax=Deinococcus cellulosilyticus (strain DSM 18568 / NBRC 106333 / KACC 11606 / 5516J-15) TaxID=1223518 RepID=A0A511N9J8_DEIC1|nr:cytochrome c [Deinococcus cellulosilyticus]GEM49196.1 c-type cytochrome [Deinococcus cellulosilyticus NBRC 106333 = KACC 11606]
MNRFAVNITILTVLLVGGGIYAYNLGVRDGSAHSVEAGHDDKGLPSPEEARESGAEGTTVDHPENPTEDPGKEGDIEGNAEVDKPIDDAADNPTNDQAKPDTAPSETVGTQEDDPERQSPGSPAGGDVINNTGNNPESNGGNSAQASGNVDSGKEVFVSNNCAGCHGANAEGGFGPKLAGVVGKWSVAEFNTTLREGKTPEGKTLQPSMPHFAANQISDEKVADLHAFLSTLQ